MAVGCQGVGKVHPKQGVFRASESLDLGLRPDAPLVVLNPVNDNPYLLIVEEELIPTVCYGFYPWLFESFRAF